jgi:hypothetical protein
MLSLPGICTFREVHPCQQEQTQQSKVGISCALAEYAHAATSWSSVLNAAPHFAAVGGVNNGQQMACKSLPRKHWIKKGNNVLLVHRGVCSFSDKAKVAEEAGTENTK